MKYVAIIDSYDELLEDDINVLKTSLFTGSWKTPFCFVINSMKSAIIVTRKMWHRRTR